MALDYNTLAQDLATALGKPSATTELSGFAQGVIEELTTNAVASTGSALGTISNMTKNSMATLIQGYAGYPSVSTELEAFCKGIIENLQVDGQVSYPSAPYLKDGTIISIDGATMAGYVKNFVGYPSVSTELEAFCSAICDHIKSNAGAINGVIS